MLQNRPRGSSARALPRAACLAAAWLAASIALPSTPAPKIHPRGLVSGHMTHSDSEGSVSPTSAEARPDVPPPATPKPIIQVEGDADHDFGIIWAAGPLAHTFRIRNAGDAPLTILSIEHG